MVCSAALCALLIILEDRKHARQLGRVSKGLNAGQSLCLRHKLSHVQSQQPFSTAPDGPLPGTQGVACTKPATIQCCS
eukprot:1161944-Pelagomonas_calceolata.AAC.8